jgi:hypothetical protein
MKIYQSIEKLLVSKLSAKGTVEFLKINRFEARQVTGLSTGHCHLKGHIFKLGITDSPICGRCHTETDTVTETASHILHECVSLAELKLHCLGKYFMEPSNYDEIPLCKILYFVRGTTLKLE